jgi:hypothetical protein
MKEANPLSELIVGAASRGLTITFWVIDDPAGRFLRVRASRYDDKRELVSAELVTSLLVIDAARYDAVYETLRELLATIGIN